MNTQFKMDDEVTVLGLGDGWIARAGKDSLGEDLYTVILKNPKLTPTGQMLARNCELALLLATKLA